MAVSMEKKPVTQYHGKRRLDEVGSLRYSDEDCMTAERMSVILAAAVAIRNGRKYELPFYASKPEYLETLEIQYCDLTEAGTAGEGCGY